MADMMNFPKRWEDFLHDYEFEDARRIYTNGSSLCLSCKHYKPRKGECKKIKGFLGEDFAHGNVYSAICPEYEPGKDWQWLKR